MSVRVGGGRSLLSDGIQGGDTMTVDSIGAIRVRFEKVLVPQSACTEFLTCFLGALVALNCLLPRPVWLFPCVA